MADSAAIQSVLGKISHDHLECSICTNDFTEPKVLDCQHTFCLGCLQELKEGHSPHSKTIPCPLCRHITTLKENGVVGLPNNFTLRAMVEDFKVQKQALGEINTRTDVPKCGKHLNQSLSLYCNTCAQLLCKTCKLRHHGTLKHDLVGLPEALERCKREVAELVAQAEKKRTEFRIALNKTEQSQKKLQSAFADTRKKISQKADEEVTKIREEEQTLKQEAERIYNDRFKTSEIAKSTNSKEVSQADNKLDEVNRLMTHGSSHEILDLKQKLLHDLKDLTGKQLKTEPDVLTFLDIEAGDKSLGKLLLGDEPKLELRAACMASPEHTDMVPLQTLCAMKGRWELKTEVVNQFNDVWGVGAFSNNKIVVTDICLRKLTTFLPVHKSLREFTTVFDGHFKDISVTRDDQLIVLDRPFVKVFNNNIRKLSTFRPGKWPNMDPVCIAVNDKNIIAVSYANRGKITLHSLNGRFLKMLRANGIGDYLTFYKQQLIYTYWSTNELVSVNSNTGDKVFSYDFDTDCSDDWRLTGVCCDIDGSIYVASQRDSGEIHHVSPNGKYIGRVINGCGRPRNITFTPGGDLVVASEDRVKIYHRV